MLRYAKKSLGQNFLIDQNFIRKILAAIKKSIDQSLNPVVGGIEIGPGQGALTKGLSTLFDPLLVVEKDDRFINELQNKFIERMSQGKFFIGHGDFLTANLEKLCAEFKGKAMVVGNLPYNVASPILIYLLKNRERFSKLFLMFQKEVALRIVATPSTKDYSLLSVWAQAFSVPTLLFDLPPSVFNPRPRVFSSFVEFTILDTPLVDNADVAPFMDWVAKLFQNRRKTMRSTLKRIYPQETPYRFSHLPENLRAETLSVVELYKVFKESRIA